ncbi:MAG: (d)CMP kinase [Gammaproteobacteria bacterium]|nr:(d)CMP kinase [Gammaproteobacteria bacterium]MCG3144400.1 Cytidylate kinase [Gammaproteobacteria bacterium]
MTTPAPVIAVDGPGGTGKGTLCLRLAETLGWHLLDSGAIYRVLAHAALARGLGLEDDAVLAAVARTLNLDFLPGGAEGIRVVLDGGDVTRAIRTEAAGNAASRVAAVPAVRVALLERQRACRRAPGLVADGRDMGTVVFPDAELKVFLTASAEERAQRRYKQLKGKGTGVSLPALIKDIAERDERDRARSVSPLVPAPDAHVLDTTHMDIDAVFDVVMGMVRERGLSR